MLCSPAGLIGEMQWQELHLNPTAATGYLLIRSNPNRVYLGVASTIFQPTQVQMTTQASLAQGSVFGLVINPNAIVELWTRRHGPLVNQAWYIIEGAANLNFTVFEVCIGPLTPM